MIEWNSTFTLPVVNALDKGTVATNSDYARLIVSNYHAAISTGIPIGAPPTPFTFGNVQGMTTIIERWLDFNRYNFLKSDIKAQRSQIRLISARIKQYKALLRDINSRIRELSTFERQISNYIRRVKRNLNNAGTNQIKTIKEFYSALLQYPDQQLQLQLSNIERSVNSLEELTSFDSKSFFSPDLIITKYSQFNTLLRQTYEMMNGIINTLKLNPDIVISAIATTTIQLVDVNSFIDAFEFDRFSVLAKYIQQIKSWLQTQITHITSYIQRTIKTALEPCQKRIESSTKEQARIGKISLYKDSKSLIRQMTRIHKSSINSELQKIREISRRIVQVYGRMILITKRVNNIIRQINTVKATGDKIGLIDASQGGHFSDLLSIALETCTPIEMGSIIALGLITEIDALSQEFLQLQRDLGIYKQQKSELHTKLSKLKQRQVNSLNSLQNDLQPFNSFVNKIILSKREIDKYQAQIKTYTAIIKSYKIQIRTFKDALRFIRASTSTLTDTPTVKQVRRIRQNLSLYAYIFPESTFVSSMDDSLVLLEEAIRFGNLTEILSLSSMIQTQLLSIDECIHTKLESITVQLISANILSKTRVLSEIQRKYNPYSLSFTNCISRALKAYWLNGTWVDPSGVFNVTYPGSNLLSLGLTLTLKPSRVSSDVINEFQRCFIAHSKTITGTYTNNSSGNTVVWNGYV